LSITQSLGKRAFSDSLLVHISGYVLVDATQQTDQRTSQMVYLFFAEALKTGEKKYYASIRALKSGC